MSKYLRIYLSKGKTKKIISLILLITFVFQFNTISVLAEEINKSLEINELREGEESIGSELERNPINIKDKSIQTDSEDPKLNFVEANKNSVVP